MFLGYSVLPFLDYQEVRLVHFVRLTYSVSQWPLVDSRCWEPRRRRSPDSHVETVFEQGAIRLDTGRHRCLVDGDEACLTAKEFDLLRELMSRPGRVVTRDVLLGRVWGRDVTVTSRTIDTHLKRLREKLGPSGGLVETVRGVGYRFAER